MHYAAISNAILLALAALTPVLALFSGLALAPLLALTGIPALYILWQNHTDIGNANPPSRIWLGLIIAYPLLSICWTLSPAEALQNWPRVAAVMLAGFALFSASRFATSSTTLKLPTILITSLCIALIIALTEWLADGLLVKTFLASLGHTPFHLHDLNRGATVIALLLIPCLFALQHSKTRAMLLALTTLLTLSQLESLAATLATTCALLTILIILLFKERGLTFIRFASLTILLLTPAIIYYGLNTEQLAPYIDNIPQTAAHRLYIWEFTAQKATEHPLFGWGFDSARHIPGADQEIAPNQTLLPLHPHNGILQLWLELGLIGVLLFVDGVNWCFRIIQESHNSWMEKATSAALVICYLVVGLTAYSIWQNWWIAAGWIAATLHRAMIRK